MFEVPIAGLDAFVSLPLLPDLFELSSSFLVGVALPTMQIIFKSFEQTLEFIKTF